MSGKLTNAQTEELIDMLLLTPDMDIFLQRLVEVAGIELDHTATDAHCSVTVLRSRKPVTVASTDPETAAMDEVQYASRQGPCMEAVVKKQVVEVTDFRTETRWPKYIAAMSGSPMRSVLAVPIPIKTAGGAALNCYSPHVGPVPEQTRNNLVDFTAVAAQAVTLSVMLQTQADKSADLAAALESRTAIDLASGVMMAQTGCTQQEAVAILMRASSNRNEKMRDVALSILARFNGTVPTTHFE
ncbi:GAF and ANTAR domain-containing protein [Arthrobacter sp. ISL-85]|uniref:GAF and ANTAR domain-containing protein n=1 Tax=Arthrobacter sp. ISL-85 TaxID=2819115 RepID=UPI001BECE37A|nr:GAF and ANTAR domain-containing protein [Arthrobacter sp. ISL-85]MBT2565280.1 GAF and ANTAR domain-containing protein [Arthrobacter sp. ISL-85]